MNESASHIAVIDVGKTNKKVLIFDARLRLLDSVYGEFPEYTHGNVHYEDVDNAFRWIKQQLSHFAATYNIQAVSVATHGATAMGLNAKGELALPPVAYTTEVDSSFRNEFYHTFGNSKALQERTATAEIGDMVNLAKLFFYMQKQWPREYQEITTVLYYPQYFGFLLTGAIGADPTYTGCHTYLYDFHKNTYSDVADRLGLTDRLPWAIRHPWEILGHLTPEIAAETGLSESCLVTMGIHDSNASLLPYIVKGYDNFVLNSTGTWCVAMRPATDVTFQQDELGKLVFYNLDAFFRPVKTSIFMGGLEHDTYTAILKQIHGKERTPEPDITILRQVLRDKRQFILPSVLQGTGIFPDARPRVIDNDQEYSLSDIQAGNSIPPLFEDYETAHTVLNLSLAIQTKAALQMAGFDGTGKIFTEGGFRKNPLYTTILASLYPGASACLTQLDEATAFGAALLAKAAMDGTTPMKSADLFHIDTTESHVCELPGIEDYESAYWELVAS